MEQIDLSKVTDVDMLKARAFDQIQTIEQAQANLRAVQQRIQQVQEAPKAKS